MSFVQCLLLDEDFMHVSNIVLSFIYQVLNVNPRRMFGSINNGRYQIVSDNVLNNLQDNVVTSSTTTSMANIVVRGILMKEKPTAVSHDSKFYVSIMKSSFINLCDFFD
jgi:hypothetical protein